MNSTTKIPSVSLNPEGTDGGQMTTLEAPYERLEALLGPPNAEGDDYKVSTWWLLSFEGRTFGIRDYKATQLYGRDLPTVSEFRKLPTYEWSICGTSTGPTLDKFMTALRAALAEKRGKQDADTERYLNERALEVAADRDEPEHETGCDCRACRPELYV